MHRWCRSRILHHTQINRDLSSYTIKAPMAGNRVELVIVFSMAGRLVFAVAALAVSFVASPMGRHYYGTSAYKAFDFFRFMRLSLYGQILWCAFVPATHRGWPYSGGQQPNNPELVCIFVADWVLTCATSGIACAAIFVLDFVTKSKACTTATMCEILGFSCVLAWVAGTLSTVTTLGIFWLLGSRFRGAA